MEGRDGVSSGGGGSMPGSLGLHLQQRPAGSAVTSPSGLHTPAPLRPAPAATAITLASPSPSPATNSSTSPSDGIATTPHSAIMSMNIGQAGSYTPIASSGMVAASLGARPEPPKRKRGRPRKYPGADASPGGSLGVSLALTPIAAKSPQSPTEKRGRGRPPGSGKKQQLAALATANGAWLAGAAGGGFTPHVITIAAGEDVANKVFGFSQQGPRAVCVLSANGSISNVTLRHDSSFGGNITYEGRYEILSLSGSFLPTDVGGTRSRTGGLSVSLAANDGKVVGGSVSGLLVAATPVQIVVGSFVPDSGIKPTRLPTSPAPAGNGESNSAMMTSIGLAPAMGSTGVTVASPPASAARLSKTEPPSAVKVASSSAPSATPNHQGGSASSAAGSTPQSMGLFQTGGWQPTQVGAERRTPTDINISLPGG
ncbi:uncharacterized protein MPTK1_8g14640 [Marchantia polymorpha subsp. ruderalis]|uniref:AT-hook motif nuclear-localized protein n=1 Tax=Marchantia polymorpha TaxID=3197 RepID=A0A2R6W549_MARPO|nr:hypothetical protein MARPO_0151s0042 [Marchantia polymorpha]PTQ28971.1 hypothetical protein MARPO_0151s0042 [Marchantia polymorpha]BBN19893.1 hypothetical protein Mp_8g14640 [Marchantia polymorpha subsp. ruderalis]BBN19894.1 hypothetical protein Mp_8g14640 [Marchantia polymorpha subsp. ruderalis]|eukprot:PTQ28970.1 hypothetical protein MARPO_0151s0042 [Marchantia polymorpha]